MGLPEEIEEELLQALTRSPWLLDLATGFDSLEHLARNSDLPEKVQDHLSLINRLLALQTEIIGAQRLAILRLGREIDDLNARVRDLEQK